VQSVKVTVDERGDYLHDYKCKCGKPMHLISQTREAKLPTCFECLPAIVMVGKEEWLITETGAMTR